MTTKIPSFADKTGRKWPLEVTVQVIRDCRKLLEIDLLDFGDTEGTTAKAFIDPLLVCELAYAMADCERRKVTSEEFAAAMNADAIQDAAQAVADAILAFFQNARRQTVAQMLASNPKLANLMAEVTLGIINLSAPATLKSGFTNAPESSELTPTVTA